MKFLEWLVIRDETQKKWAELGGYTCLDRDPEVGRAFRRQATPYNKAFYETMFKVKRFLGAAAVRRTAR